MNKACVVCGSENLHPRGVYIKCGDCGHEMLGAKVGQTYIINDEIETESLAKFTFLDRFKNKLLRQCLGENSRFLIDFGSATGRFIYQNKGLLPRMAGVEVTPEVLDYSRNVLGLEIFMDLNEADVPADIITSWHSLEHVPLELTDDIITKVNNNLRKDGVFLVSVPNAGSLQYRLFNRRYAYYDVPNHHHQFTLASLDILLGKASLKRKRLYYSNVYNLFGWIQGLLNYTNNTHNYLYYRIKRNDIRRSPLTELSQYLWLPLVLPISLIGLSLEYVFPRYQSVITAEYVKSDEVG